MDLGKRPGTSNAIMLPSSEEWGESLQEYKSGKVSLPTWKTIVVWKRTDSWAFLIRI
jgi:hypothetical protein